MSDDLRSYGSIASVARVAAITPAAGPPVTYNELFVFYYHTLTGELRFVIFGLGNTDPMKRESQGTVKDARGNIVVVHNNNTMNPLAATYDPITDTIMVFYTDEQALIRDVFSGDGGNTWHPGTLANMSAHAMDIHVMIAYFDPSADVTRLVTVDDNMFLHEMKESGGSWSESVVIP